VVYQVRGNLHEDAPVVETKPVVLDGDSIAPVGAQGPAAQARLGSEDALSLLEEREPSGLSPDEVLALSLGREARAQRKARAFVQSLTDKSEDDATRKDLDKFYALSGDQRTFRETLLAMAESDWESAPDLIYEVTRRHRLEKDISEFALNLLLSPEVEKNASPALRVVIDAEKTNECPGVRDLAERALQDADARAVRHMAKFAERRGCGVLDQEDCYPCLRSDRLLVDALRAAQDRPAPY